VLVPLHAAPVLPPDLVEGVGDLAEGAASYRAQQLLEDVPSVAGDGLEIVNRLRRSVCVAGVEVGEVGEPGVLLVGSGAGQRRLGGVLAVLGDEGVDPDQGVLPVVLERLGAVPGPTEP
jgi:hypothetical protein